MCSNILIPTDGSEFAWKAVRHGIDLAKQIGAKTIVLTVLPLFPTFTTDLLAKPRMIGYEKYLRILGTLE
jgi:nucleotide-binding universal stress UspA family protein